MNELYREQRPLVCDDLSDDEFTRSYSPRLQTRIRSVVYSGRAKYRLKGASAIIVNWPEYWWSALKYWWIGLGMILITMFIIYNSIVSLAMIPPAYIKTRLNENTPLSISSKRLPLFDVYIHAFSNNKSGVVNVMEFLPYVEIIAKRYPNLKFNFIVVLNDISEENNNLSEVENNNIALNFLRSEMTLEDQKISIVRNIVISHISLSRCMSDSPLQKFWKTLPIQRIEYLVRALAIWEKGGIAFNPVILTPKSPNPSYMEKIQNLLDKYTDIENETKGTISKQRMQPKLRVNNIRDIIDALEVNDSSYNQLQLNLTEAEDANISIIAKNNTEINSLVNSNQLPVELYRNFHYNINENLTNADTNNYKIHSNTTKILNLEEVKSSTENNSFKQINVEKKAKSILLPLFLHKQTSDKNDTVKIKEMKKRNNLNENSPRHHNYITNSFSSHTNSVLVHNETEVSSDNEYNLAIDLKGNIIASDTPCHAFIGNILSNAGSHTEDETLVNFIITELTAFCKGVLSACKGIEVILL